MELREAVDQASDNALARSAVAAQIAHELRAIEMETDVAMRELITRPQVETWSVALDALNRLRAMRRAHEESAR
jgi:predicted kinase